MIFAKSTSALRCGRDLSTVVVLVISAICYSTQNADAVYSAANDRQSFSFKIRRICALSMVKQ
jgi:hypothetical protein